MLIRLLYLMMIRLVGALGLLVRSDTEVLAEVLAGTAPTTSQRRDQRVPPSSLTSSSKCQPTAMYGVLARYRVQRFTPLLADAASFTRHSPGDRWFVDETYVKVNGVWRYVYRTIDQYGQVIDVLVSTRRDAAAARRFFTRALRTLKVIPVEVVTDAAPVYPAVLDELVPAAWHHVEQYANNPIEADHGQLKRRLRLMRGLKTDHTAQVVIVGHAFLQNLRRGHYELAVHTTPAERVAAAFRAMLETCG